MAVGDTSLDLDFDFFLPFLSRLFEREDLCRREEVCLEDEECPWVPLVRDFDLDRERLPPRATSLSLDRPLLLVLSGLTECW
jgi:hypothetical protein